MPLDLTPLSESTEALTRLYTDRYGFEFLRPGPSTFPGATTYPGLYGEELGLTLGANAEATETLTPLTED